MVIKKGLSEVIGFLIILIILVAILVPLTLLYFSQPSIQQEQIESVQAYKNLATQQFRDLDSIPFIYNSTTNAVYFVFIGNSSPPIPLVIKELAVFNGKEWVMQNVSIDVSPKNANTMYFGYPAIEIPLSATPYDKQSSYVATVTQYGNIIYASSIDPALLRNNNNGNTSIITFPYYHDYGMPLDPSVLDLNLPTGLQSAFSPAFPDWNVLEGIASPSALSLVPINVTIGDPATYNWALTDAVLVFHPLSPDGWINITYYIASIPQFPYYPITLFNKTINTYLISWDQINGSIGVYIPINMSATFAFNPLNDSNEYITQNISIPEYLFIYDGNGEITNFTWFEQAPPNTTINITKIIHIIHGNYTENFTIVYEAEHLNFSWTYTQIGCSIYTPPPGCFYFWSYLIPTSNLQNVFGVSIANNPYCYFGENPINLPPTNWFNWSKIPPYNLYPLWNVTHTEFVPHYFGEHFIPIVYIPITVYQVDINLHKGEVLDYAYDGYNNTWLLLYNWTFNYNNPAMYINAYKYFVQNGYHHLPCVYYNNEWGYVFPYNINNIEYLTEYPVYVVVPDGVYLLQVSLS